MLREWRGAYALQTEFGVCGRVSRGRGRGREKYCPQLVEKIVLEYFDSNKCSILDGVQARRGVSLANPGLAGIAALDDPCPDVIKLSIKLSSLAITVLHIDPVSPPSSELTGSLHDDADITHPLAHMADKFFSNLGTYGFGGKDFEDMTEKFAVACTKDHLRYLMIL